jgi:diguanylate cyclase (GGDEF)-like protein
MSRLSPQDSSADPTPTPTHETTSKSETTASASGWMMALRRLLAAVQGEADRLSPTVREQLNRALEMIRSAIPATVPDTMAEPKAPADEFRWISEWLGRPLRVLLVGQDADQLESFFAAMGSTDHWPRVTLTREVASASRLLSKERFDLLVYAHAANEENDFTALNTLQSHSACPPVIFVASDGDEGLAAAAFKAGVYDYVPKRELTPHLVRRTIWQVLRRTRLEAELEAAHARLAELVNRDPLTGLYNRRYFESRLAIEFARAHRFREPLSLILLDVDRFKTINDRYGHPVGDRVLANVGKALLLLSRKIDLVARIGGEEFALVLPHTTAAGAEALAERIIATVREATVDADAGPVRITVSAGMAAFPDCPAKTRMQLFECADRALYKAKEQGRDRISTYEP